MDQLLRHLHPLVGQVLLAPGGLNLGPASPLAVSSAKTVDPAPLALGGYRAQMRFF